LKREGPKAKQNSQDLKLSKRGMIIKIQISAKEERTSVIGYAPSLFIVGGRRLINNKQKAVLSLSVLTTGWAE
jgi:hypothetical protein